MPEKKPFSITVARLAELLNCPYEGNGDTLITGVAGLEEVGPGDLVFLALPKFRPLLEKTKASAAIVLPEESVPGMAVIKSSTPHLSFIKAVEMFHTPHRPEPGLHPQASVSPKARIGEDVAVGAFAVIEEDVEIGEGTVIFPLVSIYPRARIGKHCVLHSHVSVREDCQIGDRVTLHNGVVVGSDGFGYIQDREGRHTKIPQKGVVIIEDDVEVGANTTIDRAALGKTVIRQGTKIDNLVQIAHNVEVGPDAVLAAQTGIAGSSRVGKNVIAGGQVGVADHVTVGDSAVLAAQTGVTKDVPPGTTVAGTPHMEIREWRKAWASIPRLYELLKDLKRLKKKINSWKGTR
ncbi:MAG: UDP-3-O-(3-hydroxymyristoyl)glucosamine N-acyltransferase [Candidatus Aminicenantales bacterium]